MFAPLEDQVHEKLFKMIPYPRAFALPRFGGATANLPLRIDGGTSQDALFPILLALLASIPCRSSVLTSAKKTAARIPCGEKDFGHDMNSPPQKQAGCTIGGLL